MVSALYIHCVSFNFLFFFRSLDLCCVRDTAENDYSLPKIRVLLMETEKKFEVFYPKKSTVDLFDGKESEKKNRREWQIFILYSFLCEEFVFFARVCVEFLERVHGKESAECGRRRERNMRYGIRIKNTMCYIINRKKRRNERMKEKKTFFSLHRRSCTHIHAYERGTTTRYSYITRPNNGIAITEKSYRKKSRLASDNCKFALRAIYTDTKQ